MTLTLEREAKSDAKAKRDYLFEVIVRDAQAAAMQIGCVAALIGRHLDVGPGPTLSALRHFLNDDSRVSQLALRYAVDAELPPDAQKELAGLYERVGEAQRELGALLLAGAKVKAEAVASAAGRWRRVAGAARDALRGLHEPTSQRLAPVFREDSTLLQEFLNEAVAGRSERFDGWGNFTPPRLRQRRQSTRLETHLPCEIVGAGGVMRGEIVNVSSTGVGFRCPAALAIGDEIALRLPDGKEWKASVLYYDRGVVGARNQTPLSDAEVLSLGRSARSP